VVSCPALFIAAPASGQGKTTFTAALARYHRKQGRKVRVFKTGPDFLDPMILEVASGNPVYQLDLWMCGEAECRQRLFEAAANADLILVEGVMGLFDGESSSADLAQTFGIPVAALIDTSGMAQTFGAIAYGLKHYRPEVPFSGVIANRVASVGHAEMLRQSMGEIPFLASLMRDEAITLPNRHLGLVQAEELDDLDRRLDQGAEQIAHTPLAQLPAAAEFSPQQKPPIDNRLEGVRIAIARDLAFAFIYPANLELLRSLGAELRFFSPLHNERIPECDALWLPGGYPELHLQRLNENHAMKHSIHEHYNQGKPIVAECGGMLYLLEELQTREGERANMVGLLPGHGIMQPKLAGLGMQSAPLPEGTLTAHTFHHSKMETSLEPTVHGVRQRGTQPGEAIYRQGRLTASYLHLYFPSNARATAALFNKN
jgi:cobyrinic acid a,c-diamide synthase